MDGDICMSINLIRSNIGRIQKDIANIHKKVSDEKKKESQLVTKINRIQGSITKNTSASTLKSKLNEIDRLNRGIANSSGKQADLLKRLFNKNNELNRYQTQLSREKEQERKKQEDLQKRREREQLDYQKKITKELEEQKRLMSSLNQRPAHTYFPDGPTEKTEEPKWDFFISHASEDKEDFVRPLSEELKRIGVKVWYDEFSLKVGDSLRQSIDKGLADSKYGVVVISTSFIKGNWPQYEVNGLVAREMEGAKVILPIWHKVAKSDVIKYSPTLADKVALNSSILDIPEIAKRLSEVL